MPRGFSTCSSSRPAALRASPPTRTADMAQSVLRNIPSVNELLDSAPLRGLTNRLSRNVVVSGVRTFLDRLRTEIHDSASEGQLPSPAELAEKIAQWIIAEEQP